MNVEIGEFLSVGFFWSIGLVVSITVVISCGSFGEVSSCSYIENSRTGRGVGGWGSSVVGNGDGFVCSDSGTTGIGNDHDDGIDEVLFVGFATNFTGTVWIIFQTLSYAITWKNKLHKGSRDLSTRSWVHVEVNDWACIIEVLVHIRTSKWENHDASSTLSDHWKYIEDIRILSILSGTETVGSDGGVVSLKICIVLDRTRCLEVSTNDAWNE